MLSPTIRQMDQNISFKILAGMEYSEARAKVVIERNKKADGGDDEAVYVTRGVYSTGWAADYTNKLLTEDEKQTAFVMMYHAISHWWSDDLQAIIQMLLLPTQEQRNEYVASSKTVSDLIPADMKEAAIKAGQEDGERQEITPRRMKRPANRKKETEHVDGN